MLLKAVANLLYELILLLCLKNLRISQDKIVSVFTVKMDLRSPMFETSRPKCSTLDSGAK